MFVTLKGIAQKQTAFNPRETRATDTVVNGRATVKLPKRPDWMGQGARQVFVELTETQATGTRTVMAQESVIATTPLIRQVVTAGRNAVAQVRVVGDAAVEFVVQ